MKEALQDIRRLLKEGAITDEHQVRLNIVTRICQSLGWDIWDPAEFQADYPLGADETVDVALVLRDESRELPQVFIRVCPPGELIPGLAELEARLSAQEQYHQIGLGILTDGVIWRFYLPEIGGYSHETLLEQIDIENGDLEVLVRFFNDTLHKDTFSIEEQSEAEKAATELRLSELIQKVKPRAIEISQANGYPAFLIAKSILECQEGVTLTLQQIKGHWDERRESTQASPTIEIDTSELEETSEADAEADYQSFLPEELRFGEWVEATLSSRKLLARGRFNTETNEFILCKGSEVARNHKQSLPKGYVKQKRQMIDEGILQLDSTGSKYIMMEDMHFNAPTPAASIAFGRTANGLVEWVDERNRPISTYDSLKAIIPLVLSKQAEDVEATEMDSESSSPPGEGITVIIRSKKLSAKGCYHVNTNELRVYKGSEVQKKHIDSLPQRYVEQKVEMIRSGVLKLNALGSRYVFTEDYSFENPTRAAAIILGRQSASGFDDWFDENGVQLVHYKQ